MHASTSDTSSAVKIRPNTEPMLASMMKSKMLPENRVDDMALKVRTLLGNRAPTRAAPWNLRLNAG